MDPYAGQLMSPSRRRAVNDKTVSTDGWRASFWWRESSSGRRCGGSRSTTVVSLRSRLKPVHMEWVNRATAASVGGFGLVIVAQSLGGGG